MQIIVSLRPSSRVRRQAQRVLREINALFVWLLASGAQACLLAGSSVLDPSFNPASGPAGGGIGVVAVQNDGKVLVGGFFTSFNSVPQKYLTRLSPDGSVDPSFNQGSGIATGTYTDELFNPTGVRAIEVQSDGRILFSGSFTNVGGLARGSIARLHADGSLDTSFTPAPIDTDWLSSIDALKVQRDGRILIGGSFRQVNGSPRAGIARLNSDGSLDTTFNPGAGVRTFSKTGEIYGPVYTIALQSDGKIIIGGGFSLVNDIYRPLIARLSADGRLDQSFNPPEFQIATPQNRYADHVTSLAVQTDGRILMGFSLGSITLERGNGIRRLNSDGSFDTGFGQDQGATSLDPFGIMVRTIALQKDGKILVGGDLTTFNRVPRNRLARLNADGSVDTFNSEGGPNGFVTAIAVQDDGRIIIAGDFTTFDATPRPGIARLIPGIMPALPVIKTQPQNQTVAYGGDVSFSVVATSATNPTYQWQWNNQKLEGRTNSTLDLKNVQFSQAGTYTVVISNSAGSITSSPALLIVEPSKPGDLDPSFDPGSGPNGSVYVMRLHSDHEILIGGEFTAFNGLPASRVARLNPDGSLDASFNPGLISGNSAGIPISVRALAVESDGKVLIGGNFNTINGTARKTLARLNKDGSLDSTFDPGSGASMTGIDPWISFVILQPDGKIVIAGNFTSFNGKAVAQYTRLNNDGSLDPEFRVVREPAPGDFGDIFALALQADGKILISLDSALQRLNPDGTVDSSFNLGYQRIFSIAVQPDGKILLGGLLDNNGSFRSSIIRVNPDGTRDTTFSPALAIGGKYVLRPFEVTSIALQEDGKVLIRGDFTQVNNVARSGVARLNADGTLDLSFDPGSKVKTADAYPIFRPTVLSQSEGKVLIGGQFSPRLLQLLGGDVVSKSPNITTQPADQSVIAGGNTELSVTAESASTPTYQWYFNNLAIPGATNRVLSFESVPFEKSGTYTVNVANAAGSTLSRPATLAVFLTSAGTVDPSFDLKVNGAVNTILPLDNGQAFLGGAFAAIQGVARGGIAKINGDGTLDSSFNPTPGISGGLGPFVSTIALQSDGKILIGGKFTTCNGLIRVNLARLESDGSLDTNFNSVAWQNDQVNAITVQGDGRILVAGQFTYSTNFPSYRNFVRLHADGRLDEAFQTSLRNSRCGGPFRCDDSGNAIIIQPDGSIVVAGAFDSSGLFKKSFVRYQETGTFDENFIPDLRYDYGDQLGRGVPTVNDMFLQADGKILLVGLFNVVGGNLGSGMARNKVARFNSDGTLDTSFDPGYGIGGDPFFDSDRSLALAVCAQPDGKIFVGGSFSQVNRVSRTNLVRLNADGKVDLSFDAGGGANGPINTVAVLLDGNVLVGGDFSQVNGIPRVGIARLFGATDVTKLFNVVRSTSSFTLSLLTRAGRAYRLEFKNSLSESTWSPLSSTIGDGGVKNLSDGSATGTQRFYRVHVE